MGRTWGPSSAGALGWTQFLPSTWRAHGVDASGDGRADPYDPHDAIHAAAGYLRASGAPGDWYRALFAYNHADWYVDRVLRQAEAYAAAGSRPGESGDDDEGCGTSPELAVTGARRVAGAGRIVPIPGFPGERIDSRLLRDVAYLARRFRILVTDGYAPSGHKANGEHPLGLALDIVPGPGGTWDDVRRLARFAEPRPDAPRPPFRWVGFNGDGGHGDPEHCSGLCRPHLHLSWEHGPAPGWRAPAAWVLVLDLADG